MKNVLGTALDRVKDAELFSIKVEKYPVKFSGNKLKSIKSSLSKSISLRVNHGGKLGFTTDTDSTDPEYLVERALESARLGPDCPFEFCKNQDVTPVDIFDPRTVSFEIEEAVEMGEKMIDYVLKKAPETVNDVHITKYFIEATYLSDGVEKTYYKTLLTRFFNTMIVGDDGFIYIDEGDSSCRITDDILGPARRIVKKVALVKDAFEMPSKPTKVIFHPKAANNILKPLTVGLSGINLISGTSPLRNKYNRWILDQRFTLADDPTISLGVESEGFDGEGVPRKRTVLFDHGVLSNYLLDLNSAAVLGYEPNGCAVRGLNSPPTPGPSNLVVSEGNVPYAQMIEGIDEGLIVEEVIGGGQSNIMAGEFSLNVSLGYKVKNGEILGRVRNTMIAGNVYDLLKNNLAAMTSERETYDHITAPYIMFDGLSVSGKG